MFSSRARRPSDSAATVLYLDHCAKMSGAEIALLLTARTLVRFTPLVVLGEDGPLGDALRSADVEVVVLPLPASARSFGRRSVGFTAPAVRRSVEVLKYARSLRCVIRERSPVLVHTNSMKAHVYGAIATRGLGLKFVAHIRDHISTDFMSAPGVAMMNAILPSADGVVANSRSTMGTVPVFPKRQPRLVLPSPVVLPTVSRRRVDREFFFGMVGRLTYWKGQHLALRAFAHAVSRGMLARLVFVGDALFGEESYREELLASCEALSIANLVTFTGHVDDVYSEMRRFDALVHASVIPEPFGQVIVQGMSMGLPVLASGEGGPAETITDGENGLLFKPRDETHLASRMREVWDSESLRTRLSEAAVITAKRYEARRVTGHLEDFYDRVLSGRRGQTHGDRLGGRRS